MVSPGYNIVVMGVSCFDGMASSTRVRNLIEPLINKKLITANNLVYQKDNQVPIGKSGILNNINFKMNVYTNRTGYLFQSDNRRQLHSYLYKRNR